MGIAAMRLLICSILAAALAAVAHAGVACNADGSNKATCCKGTKGYCTQIRASDIQMNDTDVCVYQNSAGQTPDANQYFNTPYYNSFVCGGDKGDCNFASYSAIKANSAVVDAAKSYTGTPTAYYGWVKNLGTTVSSTGFNNISSGADQARTYWKAFNVALSRYNCEEQYSHWNCDDCRKAYARWACAMTMPSCIPASCSDMKPCVRVCNEVVQKCPVTLGFTCPQVSNDDRDYTSAGGNYMGLVAGASTTTISMAASSVVVLALAVLAQ